MGDPCLGVRQSFNLTLVNVDAVDGNRPGAKDARVSQAVDHALTALPQRVPLVGYTLGHVDVEAEPDLICPGDAAVQRFIR
jgi:hypothetical protein